MRIFLIWKIPFFSVEREKKYKTNKHVFYCDEGTVKETFT